MAKWAGVIGFAETKETSPGVWEEEITEHFCCGDLLRNSRRLQTTDSVNDDISISNQISVIADPYVVSNIWCIRYVEFMDTKFKVSDAEVQYPRIVLSLGGVYR